ncbi:hypothetical protein ACHAXA_001770 [Cyclostephanos tholiformis]|uniref:Thioredoxin-like protein n=1 Tax=Cyclostephanos tholiformis TaxID=382380 RepID=A0ABD3RXJ3_9STRA
MDLGFGNKNQVLGNQAASTILRATRIQEDAIQEEIEKCDVILNDMKDDDLEKLRERRLAYMKAASAQRAEWLANGHGGYDRYFGGGGGQHGGDVARAFFDASSRSANMVVHFHRDTTRSCDAFHRALSILAPRHPETRFVGIDVGGCDDPRESGSGVGSKFLVEKLGIVVMPTLLIVKDRRAVHHIRGFDELGGREDFELRILANVLVGHGAITRRDDDDDDDDDGTRTMMGSSSGGGGRGRGGGGGVGRRGGSAAALRMFGMAGGGNGGGLTSGPRAGGYDDFDSDED